jgi:26S proteasome non-ATPase regulatory subunit 10
MSAQETKLERAIAADDIAALEVLLAHDATLATATNDDGRSTLHLASAAGATECVRVLGARGAEPGTTDTAGWTPLHSACSAGHAETASLLMSLGASHTATTTRGVTPLHYAASKGHAAIVTALLSAGADPSAQDEDGQSPLHRACAGSRIRIAKMLVEVRGGVKKIRDWSRGGGGGDILFSP